VEVVEPVLLGAQQDKVVQAEEVIVVTMVVTPVLEHKEIREVEQTFLKRVDKDMVLVQVVEEDVTPQEI
jgi:hypothetical protein